MLNKINKYARPSINTKEYFINVNLILSRYIIK